MEKFRIVIPLVPEGKRRHRTRVIVEKEHQSRILRRGEKVKPVARAQEYPDPQQNEHIEQFQGVLRRLWKGEPITDPCLLGVIAFMPLPESKPKWWKEAALLGKIRPALKPDLDNIVKLVKDVSNGILWRDDAQIVGFLQTGKFYSEHPRYILEIQKLPNEANFRSGASDPKQLTISIKDPSSGKIVPLRPVIKIRGNNAA